MVFVLIVFGFFGLFSITALLHDEPELAMTTAFCCFPLAIGVLAATVPG